MKEKRNKPWATLGTKSHGPNHVGLFVRTKNDKEGLKGEKEYIQEITKWSGLEAITNAREKLETVIFMWIPSHVRMVPNIMAYNIAARQQEEAPEAM
eukprot:6189874-Pleurochrysis_carterae.AAC.3